MLSRVCFLLLYYFLGTADLSAQALSVDSLEQELKTTKQDTSKVNLHRMIAGILLNTNPAKALAHAKAGVSLGQKIGFDKGVAGCYLNMSVVYNAASKIDSFLIYTDSAIVWAKKVGEHNRLALAYLNRADAHIQLRNLKQSLLDCDTALQYAELANNNDRRARIYQTIGTVYYSQDKYEESLQYYERAASIYLPEKNDRMYAIILNNLANIFKRTGRQDSALHKYKKAIEHANIAGDIVNMSMYYSNISSLYNFAQQYKKAEMNATLALKYAIDGENEVQQADAYHNFAISYLNQNQYTKAIETALKAYTVNEQYGLIEEQNDAAKILADAYAANGQYKEASHYYKTARELNDSLLKKKFDEEIAYMQTSLKVEEKNNEINLLTKDKLIQAQNISRQRILIASAFIFSLLAIAALFLLVNRQRLKQHMRELQLRNEIAGDLHDEVGSSLSSIHMLSAMAASDKTEPLKQKEILQKVNSYSKETMEKMSDIVWMIKHSNPDDKTLPERMKHFLIDICKSKNIEPLYNIDEPILNKLNAIQRKNVYLVFKEAVNNAVKYSDATEIAATILQNGSQVELLITDNGVGFDVNAKHKGNGLSNIQSRAKELNGTTQIESVPGKGTTTIMRFMLVPG